MLWRNKHVSNYLDNSVFGDTIFNGYSGETVDFDADDSAIAENINAQRFIFKRSMEVSLEGKISLMCGHGVEFILAWKTPLGIPVTSVFSAL